MLIGYTHITRQYHYLLRSWPGVVSSVSVQPYRIWLNNTVYNNRCIHAFIYVYTRIHVHTLLPTYYLSTYNYTYTDTYIYVHVTCRPTLQCEQNPNISLCLYSSRLSICPTIPFRLGLKKCNFKWYNDIFRSRRRKTKYIKAQSVLSISSYPPWSCAARCMVLLGVSLYTHTLGLTGIAVVEPRAPSGCRLAEKPRGHLLSEPAPFYSPYTTHTRHHGLDRVEQGSEQDYQLSNVRHGCEQWFGVTCKRSPIRSSS